MPRAAVAAVVDTKIMAQAGWGIKVNTTNEPESMGRREK